MSLDEWVTWFGSIIISSVDWLHNISIFGVPVLYILLALIIMGVVIRAIPFRA